MADRKEYNFQFMPLEGRLPGLMLERQIEDAINDLGIWVVDVSETATSAMTLAQDAYDRAIDAQSTADKAQSAADAAQSMSDDAMRAAENAQSTADQAQASADEAMAAAKAAQESADHAQETADAAQESANKAQTSADDAMTAAQGAQESADTAQESAEKAQETADTAQDSASAAQKTADAAQESADAAQRTANQALTAANEGKDYIRIGFPDEEGEENPAEIIDLNTYYEFGRWHTAAGVLNAPSDDAEYFIDVDIDDSEENVCQKAVMVDTGDTYIRWAVIAEDEETEEVTVTWSDWQKSSGSGAEGTVYTFKGSVETYGDLPEDPEAGDVYNISEADEEHHIKAGDNVAWTGEEWDNLSGIFDTSGLETKISEVLQVANNAQDTAEEAVSDVDYADKIMTVTKGDGTSKKYTIDTCDCPNMIVDISLEGETLTFTFKDGEAKSYIIPNIKEVEPIEPTNGTLRISGDLDGDLIVNGNVEVSGNISGNVVASGTITAGSVSGSITENATLTECDLEVDGRGTVDMISNTVTVTDGKVQTAGDLETDYSPASLTVYCDMEVGEILNRNILTINGTVTATNVTQVSTLTVNGTLNADNINISDNDTVIVNGTAKVNYLWSYGTLTINEGASMELNCCDLNASMYTTITNINVINGTLTVNTDSKSALGSDAIITIGSTGYVSLKGKPYGLENHEGTVTVDGMLVAEGTTYGIYNYGGTLTINGTVTATGGTAGICDNDGTINGTGTATSNGEPYTW